jgi:hypothetical protein
MSKKAYFCPSLSQANPLALGQNIAEFWRLYVKNAKKAYFCSRAFHLRERKLEQTSLFSNMVDRIRFRDRMPRINEKGRR